MAVYGVLLLVIYGGAIASVLLGSERDDNSLSAAWWGFSTLGAVIFFAPTAFWWWRPGRTSYQVANGHLTVLQGAKVLFDWPCADIYGLWVRGGATWPQLLNPGLDMADGKFPHLVVWTDQKVSTPPILRAGRSAVRDLEHELISACRTSGARVRLTDV